MTDSANLRPSMTYGGSGGRPFSDQLPDGARICEVYIRHGEYVDGIRLSWTTADGSRVDGPYHGGPGGNPFKENFKSGPSPVVHAQVHPP